VRNKVKIGSLNKKKKEVKIGLFSKKEKEGVERKGDEMISGGH